MNEERIDENRGGPSTADPVNAGDRPEAREQAETQERMEAERPAGYMTPPGEAAEQPARPSDAPRAEAAAREEGEMAPLFSQEDAGGYRSRWDDIQAGFVDEPRRAVEQADGLVAEVMKRLAQGFADERGRLEGQWSRGDNISTEDLRLALRRYRSFFDRLLSI